MYCLIYRHYMVAYIYDKVKQIMREELELTYDSQIFFLWNMMLILFDAFFVYFFSYQVS